MGSELGNISKSTDLEMEALGALVKAELAKSTGSGVGDPKGEQGAREEYRVKGEDRGDSMTHSRSTISISWRKERWREMGQKEGKRRRGEKGKKGGREERRREGGRWGGKERKGRVANSK